MLTLKSRHSFGSTAPDRLATVKADKLPKLAKAAGWDFVLLADERTMAGALEFLAAATKAGIRAAAGIQATELRWRGWELGIVLVPLSQSGLARLVRAADKIAAAETMEAVLAAMESSRLPGGEGPTDVAGLLLTGPEAAHAPIGDLTTLRSSLQQAGLGPAVALAEGGPDKAEMAHAPWPAADRAHREGGMPLARLTLGWAAEDLPQSVQDGLVALARDNADKNVAKAHAKRPRMPPRIAIPVYDPGRAEEGPAVVSGMITSRIQPMTLSADPTLPVRLGLADGVDAAEELARYAREGLEALAIAGRLSNTAESRQRLEHELRVICPMGFANYFLIIREAVAYARSKGIPVGPGRGSVAGSMVAYALGLTSIDPIRHKLLFERFINPERISLPDIDTDFCEQRRHEVISHLADLYGDDRVAHISTYATNKPRGAVRTAGRILNQTAAATRLIADIEARIGKVRGLEDDVVNAKVSEVVEAISVEAGDPEVRRLAELSTVFLGIASTQSVHAGGVVLSDKPICETAPIHAGRSEYGRLIVQYDMKATENCGLVKFDLLGLTTLTIVRDCVNQLAARGVSIDPENLPQDDPAVFEMIRKGRTRTVFQLERGGISQAAREIGVDNFEDIVALVALYRPGPMANIPTYAARKRGNAAITYLHPLMEPILADTYGIIVYQEQVMQIARAVAGYTLASADILRKAIGKKDAKLLASQRTTFIEQAVAEGHDKTLAEEIWSFILPFAEYGFNRSHAAAYATISYQTAWLKHHYPAEWHAACASRKSKPEERARIVADAERGGVPLVLPDVNKSGTEFSTLVDDHGTMAIVAPLRCIDGTRGESIETILIAREKAGRFASFTHLLSVTDPSCDATLATMIKAGACDSLSTLPPTIARPHFIRLLDEGIDRASRRRDERQNDLMGLVRTESAGPPADPAPVLWPAQSNGIKPLAPDEALAIQEQLLKGMIEHRHGQIATTGWLREIEGLLDLSAAARVAAKVETPALGILVALGERESKGSAKRVLQATVEDETGRLTFDVASGADVHPDLTAAKGRVVRLLLVPSPKEAFISDLPLVGAIATCEDPLSATPAPYPIVRLDCEVDDATRQELRAAMLAASRAARKGAANGAKRRPSSHALLVPPSRVIEAMEITSAVSKLGAAQVFGALEFVLEATD